MLVRLLLLQRQVSPTGPGAGRLPPTATAPFCLTSTDPAGQASALASAHPFYPLPPLVSRRLFSAVRPTIASLLPTGSPRLLPVPVVMGGKRKGTSSASASNTPAVTPSHASTADHAPVDEVATAAEEIDGPNPITTAKQSTSSSQKSPHKIQLRRSGRHVEVMEDVGNNKRRRVQGEGLGMTDAVDSEDSETVSEVKSSAREGVAVAIEGLARMERRLRRATRRDKIRIKESSFESRAEEQVEEEDAFKPPAKAPIPDTKPPPGSRTLSIGNRLLTPENEMSDAEPDDNADGDWGPETGVIGGMELEDVVEDTPERGAARVPPVNSNYLPLPWTGRLGYVSWRNVRAAACRWS
jgi:hypothetical protein